MKQLVSVILVLLIGIQSFYPLAIYSYYYANRSYIAAALCENRDKPQLQCRGNCFLKKQLDKAEAQESNDKTSVKGAESFSYIPATPVSTEHLRYSVATDYPPFEVDNYTYSFNASCFRPPCV